MDAIEIFGFEQELVAFYIPCSVPRVSLDLHILHESNETFFLFLDISRVVKRQLLPRLS
jgi:hypothetical protein